MVKFSERLRQAISLRRISQKELSKKSKISQASISEYLSGGYQPKIDKLDALAEALNVSSTWLLGYDVPMNDGTKEILHEPNEISLEELKHRPILNDLISASRNLSDEQIKQVIGFMGILGGD